MVTMTVGITLAAFGLIMLGVVIIIIVKGEPK